MDGGGRRPHTALYEMIYYVRFMYACESLASTHFLWRPHTSFLGLHPCSGLGHRCLFQCAYQVQLNSWFLRLIKFKMRLYGRFFLVFRYTSFEATVSSSILQHKN